MIDQNKLFPILKQIFPQGSDEQIRAGLAKFAQMAPNLTDQQAVNTLALMLQHPKVKKLMKPTLAKYLKTGK